MKNKENTFNWIILIVIIFIQNYYFENISYYNLSCPLVSRVADIQSIEQVMNPIDILAMLSPVLIFIICFGGWGDFYIKNYGILHIVRSKSILIHVASIYIKIIVCILVFILTQLLVWLIFFRQQAEINLIFMARQIFDYILIITGVTSLQLLLEIVFDRQIAILTMDCSLLISLLIFSRIKNEIVGNIIAPLRLVYTFDGMIGVLLSLVMVFVIYLSTVRYITKADII